MSALTTTGVPFDSAPTRLPVDADDVDVLLASLESELDERTPLIDVYDDYFDGRHRLTFVSARFREVFAQMLAAVADNWCPVVVRASVERLHVQGFRMTEQADSDSVAWEIWQRNELDEGADLAFTEAVKHGESYLLVWWDDLNPEQARITVEHPLQVIVRRVPGDRTRLRAALKRWWDPDFEAWFATLWTPDTVYRRWRGPKDAWWSPYGDAAAEPNPLQTVPVVPLVNDPHMLPSRPPGALLAVPHRIPESSVVGLGRSDLADVVSTQDQVNKLVCDMMVASELGAFRQRWATGLEVPRDPETGDPIEPFRSAVNRLWIAENADSRFGDFAATDLDNYIKAITSRIQSLASRSRVPWHYLLAGMGAVPSRRVAQGRRDGAGREGGRQATQLRVAARAGNAARVPGRRRRRPRPRVEGRGRLGAIGVPYRISVRRRAGQEAVDRGADPPAVGGLRLLAPADRTVPRDAARAGNGVGAARRRAGPGRAQPAARAEPAGRPDTRGGRGCPERLRPSA